MKTLILVAGNFIIVFCLGACDDLSPDEADSGPAIVFHIGQGCLRCAEQAIENGADVNAANSFGVTALMEASGPLQTVGEPEAIRRGYDIPQLEFVSLVERLVLAKAEINAEDQNGITALYRAVKNNRIGTAYVLLSNNAIFSTRQDRLPREVFIAGRECFPTMTILLARAANQQFDPERLYDAINEDPDVCDVVKSANVGSNWRTTSFVATDLIE